MSHKFAFAIGDVHGRVDLFVSALRAIMAYVKDKNLNVNECVIIALGDYIDRGPNSKQVIDILMKNPHIIALRGNHEQFLLDSYDPVTYNPLYESPSYVWMTNGGVNTLESYGPLEDNNWLENIPKDHIEWVSKLPTFYETEHHYFVHAGLSPYSDINDQYDKDRLWIRYAFLNSNHDFGKHIVHGHTIEQEPDLKQHQTGLDCGGYYYGRLCVGVFDLTEGPYGPVDILFGK